MTPVSWALIYYTARFACSIFSMFYSPHRFSMRNPNFLDIFLYVHMFYTLFFCVHNLCKSFEALIPSLFVRIVKHPIYSFLLFVFVLSFVIFLVSVLIFVGFYTFVDMFLLFLSFFRNIFGDLFKVFVIFPHAYPFCHHVSRS